MKSRKLLISVATVAALVATTLGSAPASAQLCSPNPHGDVADVFYEGTVIFWEPRVEYQEMVLTVGGPCEDIVKVFRPGEQIFFDLREIQRVTDGTYTWELRRTATIDPETQEALDQSRAKGDESIWWNLFQQGAIPAGPYVESESFTVDRGEIVPPATGEKSGGALAELDGNGAAPAAAGPMSAGFAEAASGGSGEPVLATRATVLTNADGVIRNSLCVGFDCPNSPSFSDTTILLMENNTRIKFDDTSTINSFPRNDWEIEANSNLNGGASYLGFNDCGQSSQGGCATDLVFAVEAGARQSALYVESDGDVGFGTSNPVVRLHTIDGDTPALRLEQDGSSGFAPQTWDVAGNETSFFIRDATNGSTLPFRIRPGASSNSLVIDSDDDIGVGTLSPDNLIHLAGSAPFIRFEETGSSTEWIVGHGTITGTSAGGGTINDAFVISVSGSGQTEFGVTPTGDFRALGNIYSAGTQLAVPDFVFEPDYPLPSLEDLQDFVTANRHLPNIPTAEEVRKGGLNLTAMQLKLLEKIEELTLYTLDQHQHISKLSSRNAELEARLQALEEQLAEAGLR